MAKKTTKSKTASEKKSSTTRKKTSTKKETTTGKKTTAKAGTKKTAAKKTTAAKSAPKKTTAKKETTKAAAKTTVKGSDKKNAEAPKRKKSRKKAYTKRELEQFRKLINGKREEIVEQLQNLRDTMMDPTTGEYINENSPYSLHMAEQGTDAMEREKVFLYAQRENKFLGYLDDALKRIDAGTYGICIECAEEPQYLCDTCPLIPKARLEAVPHSQHCLPIKMRQEKHKLR